MLLFNMFKVNTKQSICTHTDQNNNKQQDTKSHTEVALEVCFSCNIIDLGEHDAISA